MGTVAAAFFGPPAGLLCLRMGGVYLSLIILGSLREILHIIIRRTEITRETMGLEVWGLTEDSKMCYSYIFLAGR